MGFEFSYDLFPCIRLYQRLGCSITHLHIQQFRHTRIGKADDPIRCHGNPYRRGIQNVLKTAGLILELLEERIECLPRQGCVHQQKDQQLRPKACSQVFDAHGVREGVYGSTHRQEIVDKTHQKEDAHDRKGPQQGQRHLATPVLA